MNRNSDIAIVLALMGVIAISAACYTIHPVLGIAVLGVFCLIGAFAAKVGI